MATRPNFDTFDPAIAQRLVGRSGKTGIDAYLGIVLDEMGPGTLRAHFDVRDELVTAYGSMHGGCLSAFADHCLGMILYPLMAEGSWAATTEFKVNLVAAVTTGTCTAGAEVIAMSRRLAVVRIDIQNEGRPVAFAQGTCTIVAPKGG